MANEKNLRPFAKGADKRRNMKGRPRHPKNFAELREAIQAFLAEPSTKNKSRLDAVLAAMARNKGERKALLEFAYGKVPLQVTGIGEGPLKVTVEYAGDQDNPPPAAPGPAEDQG